MEKGLTPKICNCFVFCRIKLSVPFNRLFNWIFRVSIAFLKYILRSIFSLSLLNRLKSTTQRKMYRSRCDKERDADRGSPAEAEMEI